MREGNIDHPISFSSNKFFDVEKNYIAVEKKYLEMVYALKKFKHYLLGFHLKLFTNNTTLFSLVNKPMFGGDNLPLDATFSRI